MVCKVVEAFLLTLMYVLHFSDQFAIYCVIDGAAAGSAGVRMEP